MPGVGAVSLLLQPVCFSLHSQGSGFLSLQQPAQSPAHRVSSVDTKAWSAYDCNWVMDPTKSGSTEKGSRPEWLVEGA